ncbi:short-chain dehydrogenase reductase ATA1, partial [Punica granatum]|uniref:Short-chain dehydrogenase reductase ATA1 n=1 Tax=Punica granatum TaxID=22663 RepID=A0A6P8C6M4_PUNGR
CSPLSRLPGKVAIITGGARGIGAGTAKLFAQHGAHVIIADIIDGLGTDLAESIGGRYIHCDVAKEADVEAAVKFALAWKGRLDIMFNNAGVSGPDGSIMRLDMDRVKALVSVNINGIVHGIKYAARAMVESGKGGSIICSASSAASLGGLAGHAYTMSKGAILSLTRSSACELGQHGIRVNCISPHGVPSEMLLFYYRRVFGRDDVTTEEVSSAVGEKGSLIKGRGGSVEDVAHAAVFLASDEAGFITGHNLVIDGGYTSAATGLSFIYQS